MNEQNIASISDGENLRKLPERWTLEGDGRNRTEDVHSVIFFEDVARVN